MTTVAAYPAAVGTTLPPLTIEATPTFVVATALATRDFQDVHHDRDLAQAKGSKDIFVNILTDTGLVERFVTDWAGPSARIGSIALKLGVPWYAYDTVTFTGEVTAVDDGVITVAVTGTNSLGKHVISTVTLTIGAAEPAPVGSEPERRGPTGRGEDL
ncbi:MaoC family dehydratase [Gordonia lacunae]|uniref:Beta-hydroxyacyl-ACP dehydratase n=1 Tax=Gordonia lacunae TaxID=417102 RepID=A0A243QFZ9_9ACTN|nr:MaoC family dehydratase [Gordonia lacunae]OUC80574.1 beta-hydroxyacyl-ACP dehydratase [Gordonia lacunae]